MEDLLNVAPCGILVFDDGGKILKANDTLMHALDYQADELAEKHIDAIFSLATRIFYNTHFFPLVKLQGRATEIFLTLVGKNKEEVPVLCNAVRRERDGGYQNIAVFMPVFERKKFEQEILHARRAAEEALKENAVLQKLTEDLEVRTQQLEKQNQRVTAINQDHVQFHKIISHDLQEPIRKIKVFASVISASAGESLAETTKGAIAKIERSADRLAKLTMALQQYVYLEPVDTHAPVDLNETVAAAAARVAAVRDFHDFDLQAERLPVVEGYRAQLELLFFHLLDNAIQFRKPEERLRITINHTLMDENMYRSLPDRYKFVQHIRITFADNGVGFDGQFKDYVFELVKKVDVGSNGVGMGLSLIKKVVTNHGGTVRIESEEGKGTNVIIVLPLQIR